jgi:transaldolase
MNNIHRLQELRQSIWLDNIDRAMLDSGELKRMIIEDGIGGITSNPSIFEKGISSGNHYDAAMIGQLARDASQSGRELFYELAIEDIQAAADLFRPVYESSQYRDGMVSLEVSPDLAYDTEATVREAHELWQRVKRPNLMIKVPATLEGVEAIERLISDGINVNATLLFSVERYLEVAEAFIRGLESRMTRGLNLDRIESVASFFISRVDVAVDAQLQARMVQVGGDQPVSAVYKNLQGKAAIANARLAYHHWQTLFASDRFSPLAAAGARSQRLLWASTGTKNPEFSDVLYIDELIGAETVNTVPPSTLKAFLDHGRAEQTLVVDGGVEQAEVLMQQFAGLDIDMAVITADLEQQGVELFINSFTNLIAVVQAKADCMLSNGKKVNG